MTDNEIIKAFDILEKMEFFGGQRAGREAWFNKPIDIQNQDIRGFLRDIDFLKAFINRQQAEIERLHDEVSKTRRKALLEARSKFAGHSDYHGDTILCKLICMAEGKEVEIATPLDKSEIKSEAIKGFVKEHKEIMRSFLDDDNEFLMKWCEYEVNTDNLVKEMVGDTE